MLAASHGDLGDSMNECNTADRDDEPASAKAWETPILTIIPTDHAGFNAAGSDDGYGFS